MRSTILPLLVSATLLGLQAPSTAAPEEDIVPVSALTAQQLLPVPQDNWLTNGGNLFNQRHSALDAVNRDNVAGLKAVWRASLHGSGLEHRLSGQAQPLV